MTAKHSLFFVSFSGRYATINHESAPACIQADGKERIPIMMRQIPELYGSLVFNDRVMRAKLPKDVYKALKKTIQNGTHLELDVANAVAVAMKEWAVENGATHQLST